MRLIEAAIIAIGIVLAALVYVVATSVLSPPSADPGRIDTLVRQVSRQGARILALDEAIKRLNERINDLEAGEAHVPVPEDHTLLQKEGHERIAPTEGATEAIRIVKAKFNHGLKQADSRFMLDRLGSPRTNFTQDCLNVTDPAIHAALVSRDFGAFKLTLLRPAMTSFSTVMERLASEAPDLYAKLGNAGALCPRYIRGSTQSISNHSWGTAVDLKLESILDPFADEETQAGLVIIAQIFNEEGWIWGGGFRREDSMHFEASQAMIDDWIAAGRP